MTPPLKNPGYAPVRHITVKAIWGWGRGGGRSPGRDGHSSVHSVDIVNVVSSTCPHGFSGKYPSKHCLSRLTYGEIYTFQLSDTWQEMNLIVEDVAWVARVVNRTTTNITIPAAEDIHVN